MERLFGNPLPVVFAFKTIPLQLITNPLLSGSKRKPKANQPFWRDKTTGSRQSCWTTVGLRTGNSLPNFPEARYLYAPGYVPWSKDRFLPRLAGMEETDRQHRQAKDPMPRLGGGYNRTLAKRTKRRQSKHLVKHV